jgi:uncharacterized protein YndB with AHSA1/START domain
MTTPGPTTAPRDIVLHRRYATSAEDVWTAFTDSDRLERWIGRYTGRGKPGGTVELTVTGELDAGGGIADPLTVTIHECSPPHRLVVEVPEGSGGSWWIAVDITADGDGAALTFTQRLVEGLTVEDVTAGWNWYLDRLGAVLHDTPMPAWTDYAP